MRVLVGLALSATLLLAALTWAELSKLPGAQNPPTALASADAQSIATPGTVNLIP